MITFLVCLTLLVGAYFVYGGYLEKLVKIDPAAETPCKRLYDGVDYVPLPRWRIFLIQLLNIAGLGPIFGAVLGAAYGPVAFLWITLGGIFMGAMHDFVAGVISLRHNGESLPETVGGYLGKGPKQFMRIFSVGLMVLVGAVFLSQPASLIVNRLDIPSLEGIAFGDFSWLMLIVLGIILLYYIAATLLPVDKIIGRIYPIFGVALLFMALGVLSVLLFSGRYTIPEFTSFRNCLADAKEFPIVPMLFTTIACGAISGFHATQSPLMARCMRNEKESRSVFYGAMISESIVALIWAAIGMAFWGGVEGLNAAIAQYNGQAAILIDIIARETLGPVLAGFVIFGVVACAITSGDTAFRSARLIVADFLGLEQRSLSKRIYICIPLFAVGLLIIFAMPFQVMWSYFAWMNQTLAAVTLWMIVAYFARQRRGLMVGLIPALIMTYVCASYIFVSPLMFGMQHRTAAYVLGGVVTLAILVAMIFKVRRDHAKGLA
ncbi:carbon starvation CstA family protein [uncultured Alistipes sp.]|uniref:carbon starvation CstA family protein n=1 Tax=uncultured Alistipes sp. TaxID=538949 RepID=UPI0026061C2D|nr:carbon starvation CstA family protein [uncultured Alistipes sp.]